MKIRRQTLFSIETPRMYLCVGMIGFTFCLYADLREIFSIRAWI